MENITNHNDILVEIPDRHLLELAAIYDEKATWAPYMSTVVDTLKKFKNDSKDKKTVIFFSPHNSWRVNGTIIVLANVGMDRKDIFVFTLEENCVTLYKGLSETNRIRYDSGSSFFYAVHEKHLPAVRRFIEVKKLKILSDVRCVLYTISPEDAKNLALNCPSDISIKDLQPSHAEIINDAWPYRYTNSQKYIRNLIEIVGGYGIFLNSTNELVAWIIKDHFGTFRMLQTGTKYAKKGYAKLVVKALAKQNATEKNWAFGFVLPHDRILSEMYDKLGCRRGGDCAFIAVNSGAKLPQYWAKL